MKREICKLFRLTRLKFFISWLFVLTVVYGFWGDLIRELMMKSNDGKITETMHLIAVSCGRPNYQGIRDIRKPIDLTLTMVKSAALFAQAPLHLHIFTEHDMMNMFTTEFEAWPSGLLSRVKYSLYSIDYNQHLPKEFASVWKKWYKPCGSYRLLTPMILKDVTSAAIYSDSDVIFIKPIDELWVYLKQMRPNEAVAISPTAGHPLGGSEDNENFIPHSSGLFQINSGVMVMNFTRMLNSDWLLFQDKKSKQSSKNVPYLKYGKDLLLAYYQQFKESAEHDQKLLNLMFHYNPGFIKQLSCSWNFKNNFCQDSSNVCSDAEVGGGAGAVHGITSVFFGDGNPAFRALYEAFLQYDFEEDVEEMLLRRFLKQLKSTALSSFCGRKAHVIIKPLTKSVSRLDSKALLGRL